MVNFKSALFIRNNFCRIGTHYNEVIYLGNIIMEFCVWDTLSYRCSSVDALRSVCGVCGLSSGNYTIGDYSMLWVQITVPCLDLSSFMCFFFTYFTYFYIFYILLLLLLSLREKKCCVS